MSVPAVFNNRDIFSQVSYFLSDNDILKFREVNKRCNHISKDRFRDIVKRNFNNEFGAIAVCEKTNTKESIRSLKTRIKMVLDFNAVPQGQILHIDEGVPSWKECQNVFDGKTFFERLKQKYSYYRGDYDRALLEKIEATFKNHQEIAKDFPTEALDPKNQLQDLRDRIRRVQILLQERVILKSNLHDYSKMPKQSLFNSLERIIFAIANFFHSFLKSPFILTEQEVASRLKNYDLPDFQKLNSNQAKFGKTSISFEGKTIPLEVRANFLNFSGKTGCHIYRTDTQKEVGNFRIQKVWGSEEWAHNLYGEGFNFDERKVLCNRRLSVGPSESMEDMLGRDSTNGDIPIKRLLTQIMVEILGLESCSKLEATANYNDSDIYDAAGFKEYGAPEDESRRLRNKRFEKARQNGQVFPVPRDRGGRTHYFHANEMQQPLVDFQLGEQPVTWEAYIKSNRLLPTAGPVLPRFFVNDYSKLESRSSDHGHILS